MPTCFIIQPFDGGAFDKRYKEVVEPAVREAGLEPYRVDQDPAVVVPIEDIERGIRESAVCLAEISADNPNVWFELGYAIACRKSVVLICSVDRERFPFDIQHRQVIRYASQSVSDFDELRKKIVQRAKALLAKDSSLQTLSVTTELAPVEGLNQQEMAVLVSLAGNLETPQDHVATYLLRRDIEGSGFTKMAAIIGIKSLTAKGFIDFNLYPDDRGEEYQAYSLTEKGWEWIMSNQDRFKMVQSDGKRNQVDDVPF